MTAIDAADPVARRAAFADTAVQLRRLAARLVPAATPHADPEETRARRAFVQDMTARNPAAFSSDLDVQAMMQHYPGQF